MASENNFCEVENLDADILGILHKVVLSESYKYGGGFTILKELIQNADDARAEEMVLSYYDGSNESFEHSPFRQKGILVYNDGVVKETEEKDDIKAIKSIAKNSKTDNDTIGKFGLGLKSIFHICETFYFFCHSDKGMELKGYINPFIDAHKKDKWHRDWKTPLPQSDVNILIEKIKSSIIGQRTSGITFFFPINPDEENTVSTVLGGERQKIDPLHPFNKGDEENGQLVKNMVAAAAILSKTSRGNLHKITYQIDETNKLVFDFDREQKKVVSWVNDSCQEYQYAVEEHYIEESELGNKILKKIRESNKEDTKKKEDPFKDSRVVFEFVRGDQAERNRGNLNIFHAVNLPLPQSQKKFDYEVDGREKNALENLEINSKYNYDLIIHAPFAIDSGRKEFVSSDKIFEEDLKEYGRLEKAISDAPQKYWNAVIYQLVILPNIPKFIKTANDEGIIDNDDIAKIVKQIRKSFGQNDLFCRQIASKYSLFNRFDAEKGSNAWCLYEHKNCGKIAEDLEEKKLKYIYVSQSETLKNKKLCKGVISDDSCFAIVGPKDASEYLMSYEDGFDNESFTKMLEQFDGELIESARFLKDFIELNKNCLQNFSGKKIKDREVRSAISRLKEILYERGRNGDISCIANAQIFCNYLKETFEIPVYYIKKDCLEQCKWTRLWNEKNPLMILPYSRNSADDKLANDEFDSSKFMVWLANEDQITDREKHDILMDIVNVETIRGLSWQEYCNLKIILVRDLEGKEECKSYSDLVKVPLFKLDEEIEIPQVMKCYQELLDERKVYLISAEERRLFLESNAKRSESDVKYYACDNKGILKCIEDGYKNNHSALYENLDHAGV